ncbi:hypothetical protein HY857_00450 [Candidatus Saccharibacteria bacterium]|nr:hypothetical protein [Candidatus Saccharibacteria bacterium]
MATSEVVDLNSSLSLESIGGKGLALSKMIKAGFNIPEGFIVTTETKANMTSSLRDSILKAFDKLGSPYVAVRSSAVAEDGKNTAWAGQFDTFLNTNRDNLIENIKNCWASAQSARAIAYAKEQGLKSGGVAVIIQRMIPSKVAGVAFSVHPVTQNKKHMIIESIYGLGEGLVSGITSPDTHVIDKQTIAIIDAALSGRKTILKKLEIINIAKQVIKIEKFFGFPVDIEWAIADKKLHILQSRPITTLG